MRHPDSRATRSACLAAIALVLGLVLPTGVAAHAELETSSPADGSTVPSPFDGPVLMTFSAALVDGSGADLLAADGSVVASATVDGPGATITIALDEPLAPGSYEVRWVSVAEDGDVERDTFSFMVEAPVATPSPTPQPTAEPTPAPSATPGATSAASASPAPSAGPIPDAAETAGTGDVLLPIVVGLLVVVAGGAYLLTRRRSGVAR